MEASDAPLREFALGLCCTSMAIGSMEASDAPLRGFALGLCCTSLAIDSMEGSVAPLRGFAFGLMLLHGLLPSRRVPSEPLQPIGVRFEPAQIRLENRPDLKCLLAGLLDEGAVRVQPFYLLPSVQELLHVPPADPSPSRTACSTTYPLTLMKCLKAQIAGAGVPSHRGRAVPEQGLKCFHLSQRDCGKEINVSMLQTAVMLIPKTDQEDT